MPSSASLPHALAAPRSTGEVISDAMDALRRSFKVVFVLAVPFCAVDLVLREFGQALFAQVATRAGAAGGDLSVLVTGLTTLLASLGAALGAFIVQQLLSAGVIAVGTQLVGGDAPSVGRALRTIGERGAALVFTALLFMTLVFSLPIVFMTGSLGVSIALSSAFEMPMLAFACIAVGIIIPLVGFIFMTLRWSLYSVVVVTEERSLWNALARSAELTASRGLPFIETPRFRLSVIFLIGLALSGVLQSLFVVPRLGISIAMGWSMADGALPGLATLPVWFMVPFGLVEVVTNAAVVPFSAFLLFFFTLDLRVRYEGVDIDAGRRDAQKPT
jgi:hypothetical protein